MVPKASVIGWFEVPDIERPQVAEATRQQEDGAARGLGLEVKRAVVRGGDDLPAAFDRLAQSGVHAMVVPNTSLLNPLHAQIVGLTTAHRLPSVGSTSFARAGGLLGYGPDGGHAGW